MFWCVFSKGITKRLVDLVISKKRCDLEQMVIIAVLKSPIMIVCVYSVDIVSNTSSTYTVLTARKIVNYTEWNFEPVYYDLDLKIFCRTRVNEWSWWNSSKFKSLHKYTVTPLPPLQIWSFLIRTFPRREYQAWYEPLLWNQDDTISGMKASL